jgi:alpha-tubulin suppressor-like RCC1 family protein
MLQASRSPRGPSAVAGALSLALLPWIGPGVANATDFSRLNIGAPVLAAGASHALLIKPNGQVWSWGGNAYGQLGDGTNTDQRNVVQTQLAGVLQVAAGTDFSLAIDGNGMLWSWGRDDKGQLANGATSTDKTKYKVPTKVDTNGDWRAVAAGDTHGLGIKMDGKLYGWGANDQGQLCKAASATPEKTPVRLGTDDTWLAVAAGKGFSIALRSDGLLFGCGTNVNGEMNTGTAGGKKESVTQLGSTRWRAVAAGTSHVVAIKEDGTLYAWGLNDKRQAGGAADKTNVPKEAQISSNLWRAVSAGDKHSVAVKADGTMWGWGDNANKQLAKSDILGPRTPIPLDLNTVDGQIVAAGKGYTALIRATGVLQTVGLGPMLGIGTAVPDQSTPVNPTPVNGDGTFATYCKPGVIAAGTGFVLAIRSNGRLQSWGANNYGQLAKGNTKDVTANYSVAGVTTGGSMWLDIAAGEEHAAGIKADGSLWFWGAPIGGEFGNGMKSSTPQLTPVQSMAGTQFVKVVAHYAQTFAIAADGKMYAAGDNAESQLGIGVSNTSEPTFKAVVAPISGTWAGVAASAHTTYGMDSRGRIYGWGDGGGGRRGDGTENQVNAPVQIGTSTSWVAFSAGENYGVAIKANGQLFGWGVNNASQLGNSSLGAAVLTPKQLFTTRRFTHVSTDRFSTLVQASKGEVWGWGANDHGELGVDFPLQTETAPKLTAWFDTRELVGGSGYFVQTCAVGGMRMVAGYDGYGQMGLGFKDENFDTDVPLSITTGF